MPTESYGNFGHYGVGESRGRFGKPRWIETSTRLAESHVLSIAVVGGRARVVAANSCLHATSGPGQQPCQLSDVPVHEPVHGRGAHGGVPPMALIALFAQLTRSTNRSTPDHGDHPMPATQRCRPPTGALRSQSYGRRAKWSIWTTRRS